MVSGLEIWLFYKLSKIVLSPSFSQGGEKCLALVDVPVVSDHPCVLQESVNVQRNYGGVRSIQV